MRSPAEARERDRAQRTFVSLATLVLGCSVEKHRLRSSRKLSAGRCLVRAALSAAAEGATLTPEFVAAAIDEYGAAWMAQDADRIARLFTEDGIYIERAFDKEATFRGRAAIREYWVRQIIGKQSNIVFRHVTSDMVVDARQGRATVKWLAEFDNARYDPGAESWTGGKIRFVQVALLRFSPDRTQITYLEEYMHSTVKRRYKWPPQGITKPSEEDLQAMFRMDEGAFRYSPGISCACQYCGEEFASRTQLFAHLRKGGNGTCALDENGEPGLLQAEYLSPSMKRKESRRQVAFTVCYSVGASTTNEIEVKDVLEGAVRAAFPSPSGHNYSVSWAADPSNVRTAIVNVCTMRLCLEVEDIRIQDDEILARVDQAVKAADKPLRVLWCTSVPRRFTAERALWFERYVALIPLDLVCHPEAPASIHPIRQARKALSSFRRSCAEHLRLRHVKVDELLDELPASHSPSSWCALSLGWRRSPGQGEALRVVGLILEWIRGVAGPESVRALLKAGNREDPALWPGEPAPAHCLVLALPRMGNDELMMGRSVCGYQLCTTEQARLVEEATSSMYENVIREEERSDHLRNWMGRLPWQRGPWELEEGCQ